MEQTWGRARAVFISTTVPVFKGRVVDVVAKVSLDVMSLLWLE